MGSLNGRTVLITGAARGIGAAFARAYVAEGATVAIGDIDLARAEATASEIGERAYAVRLDVTDQASIDAAIPEVVAKAGGLAPDAHAQAVRLAVAIGIARLDAEQVVRRRLEEHAVERDLA